VQLAPDPAEMTTVEQVADALFPDLKGPIAGK
jgi:hypothetical protein